MDSILRDRKRRLPVYLGQAALAVGVIVLWELSVRWHLLNGFKFGEPSKIWLFFHQAVARGALLPNVGVTLYEEALGFASGMLIGTAIGLGLWWSPTLARIVDPFAVMFNSIPKVALAPPMIVWFGIYETSKIVLAATICFIVAWMTAYDAVKNLDADLLDMARAVGGNRWQTFIKIVLPSSLPWIASAARINVGLGLAGAVVGEWVASNRGLGFLAAQAAIYFQVNQLWMVIAVIILLAALQYGVLLYAERRLMSWTERDAVRTTR